MVAGRAQLLLPGGEAGVCGHADALVEARGARQRVRVDVEVAASLAAVAQGAEDVPQQRLGDPSAGCATVPSAAT